jgi:flagellin-specific chaperone FliS
MSIATISSNNTDYINNLNTEISSANAEELAEDLNDSYNYFNDQLNLANLQNNISQEILLKQEQLLKMENEKLNSQLYNLDQAQSIISNKDTITKQTNQELSKKNNNINFLIFMLIISLLTFIVIMLGRQGVIDNIKMNAILGVLCLHVFIGVIIFYDFLYLGTAFKNMFYNRDDIMINKLNNWKFASNIVNAVDTSLYGTESDWQNANCQYPCNTNEEEEEESTTVASYNNISVVPTPGYYYNDGSAPSQLLNPSGTYNNTNSEKQLIYWPDYDQSNKITHDYNIQPQNIMNTLLNSPVPDNYVFNSEDDTSNIDGNLTGNYTITSNL